MSFDYAMGPAVYEIALPGPLGGLVDGAIDVTPPPASELAMVIRLKGFQPRIEGLSVSVHSGSQR